MKTIRVSEAGVALAMSLLLTTGLCSANAAPVSEASTNGGLDLRVRPAPPLGSARTPEDPRYATDVRSRAPGALLPLVIIDARDPYRSKALFEHEQRLQVLDAEVPLSLKLGKWKTHDERKAMGLSATVPLRDPLP